MRRLLLSILCLLAASAARAEVKEPETGLMFPETLAVGKTTVLCTGADVRTKYFLNIYAIAVYGDPASAPKSSKPLKKLRHWQTVRAAKAARMRFVRDATAAYVRQGSTRALDDAKYDGPNRKGYLNAITDCEAGTVMTFLAEADGTLMLYKNDKLMGTWKDHALIEATWASWMSEKTIVDDRTRLVARKIKKK